MVVGRRRVAAASVATAYALHVYVLPNTIFDRPKPAIPPLSTHPQKFVCTRVADTSRGCWYSFLSIFATRAGSLDPLSPGPCTLRRATHTIPPCYERHAGKRRETTPSLTLVYPRLSTHCSHSFSSYLFCSYYYSLVSQPYARIEAVYIAYCGLSRN